MKKSLRKKGFTLIELVIVIAIIALLAAIAIPRYQKSRDQAAVTAHNANVSMLKTAASVRLNEMSPNDGLETWPNDISSSYVDKWPEIPNNIESLKEKEGYTLTIDPAKGEIIVDPEEIEWCFLYLVQSLVHFVIYL